MGLLHKELTYILRGCIYDVHNAMGTGYDEESYHKALEYRLRKSNIPFRSQVLRHIEHCGVKAHKFVLDLIVDDKIILELIPI